jgi:capsular polysaccharide transport system permease protein
LETTTDTPVTAASATPPGRWSSLKRRFNAIFLITVLIPTAVAAIYYGLIASDVYISESHFVVRSSQRQSQIGGIGALLQSTGFSRSQDDTYSVHDYVLSRDALRQLMTRMDVRKALQPSAIDVVNRFPGPSLDDSFEAFYRHYKHHVAVEFDTVSSISTLYVRAYTAEDAQKIDDELLTMGEQLINALNDRSRNDLVGAAQREVAEAETRAKTASLALSGFRSKQSLFDPDRQSLLQLQGVAKLQDQLLTLQAQYAQLQQLSPSNPQIATLRSQIEQMKQTIASESARVSGGEGSFTSKETGYDRLLLEKTFADRQLASAFASLETARNDAQRQQLYLERLVQANKPDKADEPKRARTVLMVFILGLILWGVVSLVVASVKEHSD